MQCGVCVFLTFYGFGFFSIAASEMELVEVGETQIEKLHAFYEDGVKGTHNVLKEAFGGVENLHGACRERERRNVGWEVLWGRREIYI